MWHFDICTLIRKDIETKMNASSSSCPTIQIIPDPANTAPQGVHHATDQQSPSLRATVQGSVDAVVQSVIGLQDPQSQSKNTFLSAAIPLSHRVPDKLKKTNMAQWICRFCTAAPQKCYQSFRGAVYCQTRHLSSGSAVFSFGTKH